MANRLLLGLKSVPVVKLRRNKVAVHGAHTCKLHCRFPWQSRWQSRRHEANVTASQRRLLFTALQVIESVQPWDRCAKPVPAFARAVCT